MEFVGCAGVGKSFIFRELKKRASPFRSGIANRVKVKRPFVNLIWGFSENELFEYATLVASQNNFSRSRYSRLKSLLVDSVEDRNYCDKGSSDCTWIFDEHFCQRSISLAARAKDPGWVVKNFLGMAPLPNVLVHVDAPSDLIVERIRRRKDKFLVRHAVKSDFELRGMVEKGRELSSLVATYCEGLGVRLVRVNATLDKHENVLKILKSSGDSICYIEKF